MDRPQHDRRSGARVRQDQIGIDALGQRLHGRDEVVRIAIGARDQRQDGFEALRKRQPDDAGIS
jgi:hypothetical protein